MNNALALVLAGALAWLGGLSLGEFLKKTNEMDFRKKITQTEKVKVISSGKKQSEQKNKDLFIILDKIQEIKNKQNNNPQVEQDISSLNQQEQFLQKQQNILREKMQLPQNQFTEDEKQDLAIRFSFIEHLQKELFETLQTLVKFINQSPNQNQQIQTDEEIQKNKNLQEESASFNTKNSNIVNRDNKQLYENNEYKNFLEIIASETDLQQLINQQQQFENEQQDISEQQKVLKDYLTYEESNILIQKNQYLDKVLGKVLERKEQVTLILKKKTLIQQEEQKNVVQIQNNKWTDDIQNIIQMIAQEKDSKKLDNLQHYIQNEIQEITQIEKRNNLSQKQSNILDQRHQELNFVLGKLFFRKEQLTMMNKKTQIQNQQVQEEIKDVEVSSEILSRDSDSIFESVSSVSSVSSVQTYDYGEVDVQSKRLKLNRLNQNIEDYNAKLEKLQLKHIRIQSKINRQQDYQKIQRYMTELELNQEEINTCIKKIQQKIQYQQKLTQELYQ